MKQNSIKLYLDIDGVLLVKNGSLANHTEAFLEWAIDNFECYWLTTRDRRGLENIILAFKQQLPIALINSIRPTQWETLKTEAIDLDSAFYWVDDGLLATEREAVGDRWIAVNVYKYPEGLLDVWEVLRGKVSE
jgi:hypothetical protein